jgi:hypothetical protein
LLRAIVAGRERAERSRWVITRRVITRWAVTRRWRRALRTATLATGSERIKLGLEVAVGFLQLCFRETSHRKLLDEGGRLSEVDEKKGGFDEKGG